MSSIKIENTNNILPITYPIRDVDSKVLSDDQTDSVSKIIKVVETHVVSTVKSIFSTIYSYAKKTRSDDISDINTIGTPAELREVYIIGSNQDLVANMV